MMQIIKKVGLKVKILSPLKRRLIRVILDLFFINISLFLTFYFSSENQFKGLLSLNYFFITTSISFTSIITYIITRQYKGLTRFIDTKMIYQLSICNLIIVFFNYLLFKVLGIADLNIENYFVLFLLITNFLGIERLILRDLIQIYQDIKEIKFPINIAIYGAGSAGLGLLNSLLLDKNYKVKYFIDDDPLLQKRSVNGIKICSREFFINRNSEIDQIFLAIPSLSFRKKFEILSFLSDCKIKVLEVPSIKDLSIGKAKINKLNPIKIEDLLERRAIKPNYDLILKSIENKVILVTGAAGSIGSEICRQILNFNPKKIIILDHNEPSLYSLQQELNNISPKKIDFIIPKLGNVTNEIYFEKVVKSYSIDIIFHAAAYKHVPLLEANPIEGIFNNIFSAKVVCSVSKKYSVEKVILISTDKAVRPKNVMGASKRVAEMIFQAYAKEVNMEKNKNTCFSMVRFGNVLDSSGSVVPLFRKQLEKGGPITLTHQNIIRYFMTIPEASQLVLQATELARGGDVFLLDMGKPIKIENLARKMIQLGGLTVKDEKNPDGDIEIKITGLRPGEKLYEELLIDNESIMTSHPLIFTSKEKFLSNEKLWFIVSQIEEALRKQDDDTSMSLLQELVPEWNRN